MGYLLALPKIVESGADAFKSVNSQVEQSRFKSFVKDNPDWADNPDKITEAISNSPQLGMSLADRSKGVAEQRNARAASRMVFLDKADKAAYKTYTETLDKGRGSSERTLGDTEEGFGGGDIGANYTAADKAANDEYQRSLLQARDLYGEGFADKLPPVWKLSDPDNPNGGYEQRAPRTQRMLDSMREPVNLIFPDGKKVTASLLPHEQTQMVRDNKGLQLEKIATSAPQKDASLDANQRATVTGKVGDDYVKQSDNFIRTGAAFRNMRAMENDPSAAGDIGIVYNYMKMLDPTSVVREGEAATAQNAASVPDAIRNLYNKAISGQSISVNRKDFVDQGERLYKERLREQEALDKGLTFAQSAYKLNEDEMAAIRSRVPRIDAAERKGAAAVPGTGKPGEGLAKTPEELAAVQTVVRDPKAPIKDFTAALGKLPEGDLTSVNVKSLTDAQLAAYTAALKARKNRAKPGAGAAKPGEKGAK